MKKKCSCLKCKKKDQDEQKKEIEENHLIHKTFFSNFYSDNQEQLVLPGQSIKFKNNGPGHCFIFRLNDSQFNLTLKGTYEIIISIYTNNQGILLIKCNDKELYETLMTNNSNYIYGHFLITTQNINTILSINNPVNSKNILNIFPDNQLPILSHLTIKKIS